MKNLTRLLMPSPSNKDATRISVSDFPIVDKKQEQPDKPAPGFNEKKKLRETMFLVLEESAIEETRLVCPFSPLLLKPCSALLGIDGRRASTDRFAFPLPGMMRYAGTGLRRGQRERRSSQSIGVSGCALFRAANEFGPAERSDYGVQARALRQGLGCGSRVYGAKSTDPRHDRVVRLERAVGNIQRGEKEEQGSRFSTEVRKLISLH